VSTQVRERVSGLQVRPVGVRRLPFGLSAAELVATLIAVVLIVSAMVYYFSTLRPEQDKLHSLEQQAEDQQKSIMAAAKAPGDVPRNDDDVKKDALESLEAFKNNHLKSFSSGRIDLIKEINALAKKNNVILTSGIDMGARAGESSTEADKSGEKRSDKKGSSRTKKTDDIINVYPNVNFRFTVFGQYANLRTFINELEHEKQFLVINSINLTNQEAKSSGRRGRGEGGMGGIMLSIEMSAYFKPVA
jgi:hypothetical protein